MADNVADFSAILKVLARHEVEFIVVGGVCAVLLGAGRAIALNGDLLLTPTRSGSALDNLDAPHNDPL